MLARLGISLAFGFAGFLVVQAAIWFGALYCPRTEFYFVFNNAVSWVVGGIIFVSILTYTADITHNPDR